VTWGFVFALAAIAYGCKFVGLVVIGGRTLPPVVARCLALIPVAMISALIVKDTFGFGRSLQIDARAAGLAAAVFAAWRSAPLIVVIVAGAGVTALLRFVAG
jgi:branched chain amino acid efflux pump